MVCPITQGDHKQEQETQGSNEKIHAQLESGHY